MYYGKILSALQQPGFCIESSCICYFTCSCFPSRSPGYQFLISTIKASLEDLYTSALEDEPKLDVKSSPLEDRSFFKEDEKIASKILHPSSEKLEEGEAAQGLPEIEDQPSECVIC